MAETASLSRFFDVLQGNHDVQIHFFDYLCRHSDHDPTTRRALKTNFLLMNKAVYAFFAPRSYRQATFVVDTAETVVNHLIWRSSTVCLHDIKVLRVNFGGRDFCRLEDRLVTKVKWLRRVVNMACLNTLSSLQSLTLTFRIVGRTTTPDTDPWIPEAPQGFAAMQDWVGWWQHVHLMTEVFPGLLEERRASEFPQLEMNNDGRMWFELEAGGRRVTFQKDEMMPGLQDVTGVNAAISFARISRAGKGLED